MSSGSDRGCGRFRRSRVARLCAGRECRHHDQRNARGPAGREVEHADERRDVDAPSRTAPGGNATTGGATAGTTETARADTSSSTDSGTAADGDPGVTDGAATGHGRVDGRGRRARRRDVDHSHVRGHVRRREGPRRRDPERPLQRGRFDRSGGRRRDRRRGAHRPGYRPELELADGAGQRGRRAAERG